ncbi:signal transduction histidine kinase [Marmoricola sp. OAE513]|uniref:sensor histidine kinase n=1 Tax=Marmoricola sp. OAE513 TaxID=2817894 RepID=UPI001AE7B8E7
MRESYVDLEREAELRAYAVLDAEQIPALERIADLAAEICGMAVAEVNAVSLDDVVHVATTNRDHLRVPREFSFCSPVISYGVDTYTVVDATKQEPFASSPYVTGERASIRSYAAARMVGPTGVVLGNLCVFDYEPREVTIDQLAALQSLSATIVEILEMRRTERELATALNRLAGSHRALHSSNESLEAFAGQISHDLQAPLTAVEVALELLEDEVDLSEDAQMLLGHARSGGRRMQSTITELLDFAVAGSSSPTVPVDLNEVVSEVLADLDWSLTDAKIEVEPLPAVLGQSAELRAVMQNLVANAVKFSAPTAVPHIQIHGESHDGTVRVTVADNGPGVPEEQREAVFGLNVRGDTDVAGYGIGLATCARIVRTRRGAIGVDPSPTGGSSFWFELPAAGQLA